MVPGEIQIPLSIILRWNIKMEWCFPASTRLYQHQQHPRSRQHRRKMPPVTGKRKAKKIKKKVFPRKTKQSNVDPSAKVEKHLNHVKGNSSFQKFSKKNDGTSVTFAPSMNSSAWSSRNSPTNSTNSNPFGDNRLPFESYSSFETQKKQDMEQENNGKGNYSSNTGLFLLLVTLSVLVCWGKVYAILWTSTWLFFVPNLNARNKLLRSKANSRSMDLAE
ncbi:uncharacterized protein LOC110653132 isoform X2 [Hevea brasiliensis]|uniref:uncharacterized protein LOC110653132 isoform X2 n=1 Tax=Hevea brasiliensis TaxID=3981 RepID=UPI0025F94615|nr:uncharacterized protein LOC110653132 isoform X2 [Hevea brasiliensis]